ncbi:p53 and DNA damage-regulated protein 1 isoform X1 [Meriones unguiculatus]|uniref:p53 and DNA damage-regulated protein 1 isoform X1 n=1 Tax=Meriones unguiculatus TaxID=10047 RepID=UPI00293E8293|nr:p53 and DNA damage-regulated protein 1 isoform X1 [Meriones unguiculatus]
MLSPEAERVLQYLVEVEELAEAVLTDKQQIVDLDTKRNRNREGLRALQKDLSSSDVYRGDILSLLSSLPGCHMCTEASHQLPTSLSSPLRLSSTLKQLSHNFFTVCGKQLLFISPSFAMILNSTRAGIVLFCCVLYI